MRLMRNSADLVNEMLAEAKTAWLVAIAIGFSDDTKFVFSSGKQPLADLNRMIRDGGSPVGLLRFDKDNEEIQGSYRPFTEYADQEWVGKYLAGLLDHTDAIIGMSRNPADNLTAY